MSKKSPAKLLSFTIIDTNRLIFAASLNQFSVTDVELLSRILLKGKKSKSQPRVHNSVDNGAARNLFK